MRAAMPFRRAKIVIALVAAVAVAGAGAAAAWAFLGPMAASEKPVPLLAAELDAEVLTQGPGAVVLGNPRGDVAVVEYFDYQCPACRRVHPFVKRLAAEDGNVRIIHKHWPVFGGVSVFAARIALAARWQGRYEPVHDALITLGGRIDEEKVRRAAAGAGLDLARADRDLMERGAELDAALNDVAAEAAVLQLRGTPRFVIGGYVTPGSLDFKSMREAVRKVRTGDSKRG